MNDPPPGVEPQVDFGRLGLVADGERRRVCWALIFTACFSRHCFVWPTFNQTTEDVIAGFEAAWMFFGGVFPVVIPDNMKSVVVKAENTAPRLNDVFLEYAQSRGFVVDAARVATPTDKPRVERTVPYVRNNFFAGETFIDLADVRARAERWCTETAGRRVHGTTQCRPREAFRAEELALLLTLPGAAFDVPRWSEPKLHGDFHVEVDKALYSAPHRFIGRHLKARRDSTSVELYFRGELVKVHARMAPGQRSTDPADFPTGKEIYATRDLDRLRRMAADHGDAIGLYAAALSTTTVGCNSSPSLPASALVRTGIPGPEPSPRTRLLRGEAAATAPTPARRARHPRRRELRGYSLAAPCKPTRGRRELTMSDVSQGPGWWQAADGKWYPPQEESATPTAATPPPPPAQGSGYGQPPPPSQAAYGTPGGPAQAGQLRVSVGDAFNYGWTKFQQNVGPIILVVLASMGISIVLFLVFNVVLLGPILSDNSGVLGFIVFVFYLVTWFLLFLLIQMAIIRGSLFIVQGRPLELRDMFATDQIGQYVVAGLILTAAYFVGMVLCIIPGLIVWFFGQYFGYFLLDKRMNSLDSLKASASFVNKNLGSLITFYIGCLIAYFVGALLCVVGLLAAIPVVVIAQAYMYRKLQGEPVAP